MASLRRYYISGRTGSTAATTNHAMCALWNPHASRIARVCEIYIVSTAAVADRLALIPISTRGTSTGNATPASFNDGGTNRQAPGTGAILDLSYSAQPTVEGSTYLRMSNRPGTIGLENAWFFNEPYIISPGKGVAIVTPANLILNASDVTFVFEE